MIVALVRTHTFDEVPLIFVCVFSNPKLEKDMHEAMSLEVLEKDDPALFTQLSDILGERRWHLGYAIVDMVDSDDLSDDRHEIRCWLPIILPPGLEADIESDLFPEKVIH